MSSSPAHAKTEYGQNFAKIGYTFDGWRQLDYWFDLVIELGKKGKKRFAKVVKTRVEQFPDEDVFEWSYDAIKQRYDIGVLEKEAQIVTLATRDQVREIKERSASCAFRKALSKNGLPRPVSKSGKTCPAKLSPSASTT